MIGFVWSGLTGCDDPSAPGPVSPPVEKVESRQETWGAVVLKGEKIGHMRQQIEHLTFGETSLVRTTTVEQMTLMRSGQPLKIVLENVYLESPQGELQKFTTKMSQAGSSVRYSGDVSADGKSLTIVTYKPNGEVANRDKIAWQSSAGGRFRFHQLFTDPPLKPGDTVEASVLMPALNRAGKTTVTAIDKEEVTLLDGSKQSLLKAKVVEQPSKDVQMESFYWLDETGQMVKSFAPAQQFELFRCSKEFALSPNKEVSFDWALDTIVPAPGMPKENRDQLEKLEYRVTLNSGEPAKVFASEANQAVKAIDEHTAELAVYRVPAEGKLPAGLPAMEAPVAADREASPLVQVNDPAVKTLSGQVASLKGTPSERAIALEKFVHQTIQEKNFSQGFLSAAEVAQAKVGDCTEHSVLLISLLRAQGIPARGAMGLVYVDYGEKHGFAYHMWTEAWVGDRWLPLDATRGKGGIGVDYIKVTQTNLSGSDAFAAFLPVSQVVGQLKVEVAP